MGRNSELRNDHSDNRASSINMRCIVVAIGGQSLGSRQLGIGINHYVLKGLDYIIRQI